jgi:hypothetical protein
MPMYVAYKFRRALRFLFFKNSNQNTTINLKKIKDGIAY